MKPTYHPFIISMLLFFTLSSCSKENFRELSVSEYRNKMKAAWIGQMAGVGWGFPTEFKYTDSIIPVEKVPVWDDKMINQHGNDDLYVELTFLGSMDKHGRNVSIRQAGIDFANSGYQLWAANNAGRENLRFGIAPPESSHPAFNNNADDIDYQIEADYSGIIAPGMLQIPVLLGEKFGRLMNYGDGLYAGQFVGGMYSAAYFENDIEKIIETGLSCIPAESHYAQCVNDVVKWYHENPDNWIATWNLIEEKYHKSDEFQQYAAQTDGVWKPIDAKLNGAYIIMGLLYGGGDMDSTIVISMRCGKDSDCNPSNAAGILATTIGFDNLPAKFKTGLDEKRKFSYSDYDFNQLLSLCETLTREYVKDEGGEIDKNENDEEVFLIPQNNAAPSAFHPSYEPGPVNENNRYSEAEMNQIKSYSDRHFDSLRLVWEMDLHINYCGKTFSPGIREWNGRSGVFSTSFMSADRSIEMAYTIPEEITENTRLIFSAGSEAGQQWKLLAGCRKAILIDTIVKATQDNDIWMDFTIDLSLLSGMKGEKINIHVFPVDGEMSNQHWEGFHLTGVK